MFIRLLTITLLFIFIAIGTIGGCGDSGIVGEFAGEVNCMDGIDNDGDTETDCEDIDCILDPACNVTCDDFLEAFCNRAVDCDGFTFLIKEGTGTPTSNSCAVLKAIKTKKTIRTIFIYITNITQPF